MLPACRAASTLRRLVASALLACACITNAAEDMLRMDTLDEPMPALQLDSVDGRDHFDSRAPHDGPLLVHFWATWCVPCQRELPQLLAYARARGERLELVLVAVDEEAGPTEIQAFANRAGVDVPVYLAGHRPDSRVFWNWGVPATYLVDRTGRLRGRFLGPRDWISPAGAAALDTQLNTMESRHKSGAGHQVSGQ